MKLKLLFFLLAGLLFIGLSPLQSSLSAQNYEQISWDDEDDEEEDDGWESGEVEDLSKYKEASVWLNDSLITLEPEMELEFPKNDTLSIRVRHLRPGSMVWVSMEKAGLKLEKKNYSANNRGELDLEVRTGGKKVKGAATLRYTPGGAEKKMIRAKVRVR